MRREFCEPLTGDPVVVPRSLMGLVRVQVRDRRLVPAARLRTRRTVRHLYDQQGRVLAEFCDDRVRADRLGATPTSQNWRE